MWQKPRIICTVVILGIIVVECNARHDMEYHYHDENSIECYECNSAYDPRCNDPFDPYTIGKVNCSKKRPLHHIPYRPTLCRKTVQKVQGYTRVIRGCGYIPDERDDKECYIRTGTHDVHVRYCSCKHSLCNSANIISSRSMALGSIFLIFTRLLG